MRAYRRILIGNGLANIPAKICTIGSSSSTESIGNACECGGDVGKKDYCKTCNKEFSKETKDQIKKVLKISKTERIPISDELYSQLKESELRIEILGTYPVKDLDTLVLGMTESVYYIWEDDKSKLAKPLNIIKYGMEKSGNVLVVNSTITGKSKLGLIRSEVIDGMSVLLLQVVTYLEYANKIDEKFTYGEHSLTSQELKLGTEYVSKQLKKVDLKAITDPYAKVVEAILSGTPMTVSVGETQDELAFFGSGK